MESFIDKLAERFANVYDAYKHHQQKEAAAAGLPPPVKKLKLAVLDTNPPGQLSAQDLSGRHVPYPRTVLMSGTIHEHSLSAEGIEVTQPYLFDIMNSQGIDEDEDDEEAAVDAEQAATAFADKTILLRRKICRMCGEKSDLQLSSVPAPEYVFWKDNRKAAVDCPKCRCILFKKFA